jgi:CheY-like chemotaxis protein
MPPERISQMKDDPTVDFSPVPCLETRTATQIVLVVDDHPGTCEITVKLIKMLGYFAHCVMSGHEALEFAASHPVGLILLDVMMPVMDGMETLVRMQSDPHLKSIPVVMHSALSDDLLRTRAFVGGAKDFLVKGNISLERLQGVLKTYLPQPA